MTTAHRPTFDPARGKDAQRGPAYHQRLLPAHTVLKHRQTGQGGVGGLGAPRDLRAELLKAEAAVKSRSAGGAILDAPPTDEDAASARSTKRKLGESDDSEEDAETKRRRLILEEARDVDADSDSAHSAADSDSDSDDEDSEDEEAELLRELAKIKAERAAQRAAEEAKLAAEAQEQREVDIALGNPLLNKERQDFGVKRRWDDDVVFKNQARGTEDRAKGRKEFVNDLLRSDFHKRFMSRYVR